MKGERVNINTSRKWLWSKAGFIPTNPKDRIPNIMGLSGNLLYSNIYQSAEATDQNKFFSDYCKNEGVFLQ